MYTIVVMLVSFIILVALTQKYIMSKADDGGYWLFLIIPIIVLSISVGAIYTVSFYKKIHYTKTIVKIGGCTRMAYCAVEYQDGSFGKESYPVIGKSYPHFYWERRL